MLIPRARIQAFNEEIVAGKCTDDGTSCHGDESGSITTRAEYVVLYTERKPGDTILHMSWMVLPKIMPPREQAQPQYKK